MQSTMKLFVLALCLTASAAALPAPAARAQINVPKIVVTDWALVEEACATPDGIIDPGERVTVSFSLQNIGGANTGQNLTATLLATGGVTAPGAPQNYGTLGAGRAPSARNFTFTAANQPFGSTITATFQLQDGPTNRGTASVEIVIGRIVLDADPGKCATSFRYSTPSTCFLTHCVAGVRQPFPVGTFIVICDTSVPTRFSFQLIVRDAEAPVIACPPDIKTKSTLVTYPAPTATDACGAPAVTCSPPSGAQFPVGLSLVNCTATDAAGNAASCAFKVTVEPDPGVPFPPGAAGSDDRAGSVLAFPLFTSSVAAARTQNTRLSLTNFHNERAATVHLFFIDGASGAVSDGFLCLSPNQTVSFLASDIDPGITGYVIAVAVDATTGCPINFNFLGGDEFVKLSTGHEANLSAESYAAIAANPAACAAGSNLAELRFDGVNYSQAGRVLALDSFSSIQDGNNTKIVINQLGGDLSSGVATISALSVVLFDDIETPYSGSIAGGYQIISGLDDCQFPRRCWLQQAVPAGRSGWVRYWSRDEQALFGAALNFNANTRSSANAFAHGHNLHKLSLTAAASLLVPVIPPRC